MARYWACPVVFWSLDNKETSVPFSQKLALSRPVGNVLPHIEMNSIKYNAFICTVQHTYSKWSDVEAAEKLTYLGHCLSQILMPFKTNTTFLRISSWLQPKKIPDRIGLYFLIKHNQSAMLCYYIPPKTQGEFIFSAIVHTTLCRWCLSPTWKKTVTQWIEILSKGAILFWCYCFLRRYILGGHTN